MSFLTEHPTGAYVILALAGALSLLVFFTTRRVSHLAGLALALLLGVGVFLIDRAVVTDREQVEANTLLLAKAAQEGEFATLERLFSDKFQMDGHGKASLVARARQHLTPGALRTITAYDLKVPRSDDPNRLACECNATASGDFGRLGRLDPPYIGTLELVYEKEGNDWRITKLSIKSLGGAEQRIP